MKNAISPASDGPRSAALMRFKGARWGASSLDGVISLVIGVD
jgi:hypothetical protein